MKFEDEGEESVSAGSSRKERQREVGWTKIERTLKKVGDGIVGHVNRRVRERLDEELLVPRDPRSETVRPRASPLLEPIENCLESVPRLREVGVHPREKTVGRGDA